MCADHVQGEVLLCSYVFAVQDGWDLEEGWGRCHSRACTARVALGREMLRHGMAARCRFGTKPASGQCRAGYGESYYGAVPHNNIYIPQHHLLLILVGPGQTKLR